MFASPLRLGVKNPRKTRQARHTPPRMSTRRSHHGCWTCKAKRQRCDNARPTCNNCHQRGQLCEGYGMRLRWGTGIASRGRYALADKPTDESIPNRPRGRRRDLSRERRKREVDSETGLQIVNAHRGSPRLCEAVDNMLSNIIWHSSPQEGSLLRQCKCRAFFYRIYR